MGLNNYQSRLQSLDVLDQYASYLKGESDFFEGYMMKLKVIHESFADNDQWNDVKHTEFFEGPVNDIILEASKMRVRIDEAIGRLYQLKASYANAGIK